MPPAQPGTYRIVSVASGTCITNYVDRSWEVMCWERHSGRNQQWYLQRSGEGYHIKNCLNGMYFTVTETSDTTPPAKVFCGRYPTTWELNQGVEDYEMYIIKRAGCDRVIDLDDWGNAFNGNQLHTHTQHHWLANKRWRFEWLSDDTGEEKQQLLKEIQIKDEEIKEKNMRIKEQNIQLNEKTCQLADQENQLALLKAQLASRDEELNEARLKLSQRSSLPTQTQDAVRGMSEWPETQGVELLRSQVQETNSRLDRELSQPTEELKGLQEKFDNLERMFVQMTSQGIKLNNIAG